MTIRDCSFINERGNMRDIEDKMNECKICHMRTDVEQVETT